MPDHLELPTDRPRPAVASIAGADVRSRSQRLHARLAELAREQNSTAVHGRARGVRRCCCRGSSAPSDIAIGTPVAGRGEAALDDLVGMFVNTLVLRTQVEPGDHVRRPAAAGPETDLAAFGHADVPFERLVEVLKPERSRRGIRCSR